MSIDLDKRLLTFISVKKNDFFLSWDQKISMGGMNGNLELILSCEINNLILRMFNSFNLLL